MSRSKARRLQRKRRYEMRCAIRQRDEHARCIREDGYLQTFVRKYETIYGIQEAMTRHMDEICTRGAAEQIRKQINDVVFQIEAEKSRQDRAELLDYRRRIEDYPQSSEERGTCPNFGVKRIRIRTQPLLAFEEAFRNVPSGPGGPHPEMRWWMIQGNIVRSIFDVAHGN